MTPCTATSSATTSTKTKRRALARRDYKMPALAPRASQLGGAGSPQHMLEVLTTGHADAALAASIFHFGRYTVAQVKQFLADHGVAVRIV